MGEDYKCSGGMVRVSHDFEAGLDDCSVVWMVDSWNELEFHRFIEPSFRLATDKGKRIVCSRDLSTEEKALVSKYDFIYVEYSSFKPKVSLDDRVQEVRTPVIYVMSSTENCNQFYIESAICAELRDRGYEALLISSRKESAAFGQYSIPNFMFNKDCSENEKVVALNYYIRYLEMKNNPEVIVIGVPGAAIPYSSNYSSDFGILAYEFSEAVKPDYTILSSPCMPYDIGYYEGIEETIHSRLGVRIDTHSLSRFALDFNDPSGKKSIGYLSVGECYIRDMIKQIKYNKLFDLSNKCGITSEVDRLISKLSNAATSIIT